MRIVCPLCGFAREMDESKVPPRAQMATCPKCAHKFRFRVVDEPDRPEAPQDGPWPSDPAAGRPGTGRVRPADLYGNRPAAPSGPAGGEAPAAPPDPMERQRAAAAEAWKRLQAPRPEGEAADHPAAAGPGDAVEPAATPGADAQAPVPPESARFGQQPEPQPWPQPEPRQDAAARSTGSPVPFEDLPRHGFFPGLWLTIRLLLTRPREFFERMPVSGGMARPLVFHLLLAEFMVASQYLWGVAGIGASAQYLGSPELMDMGLKSSGAAPVLLLVIYPLLLVLRLMLMTGVIHLLLKLLRAGKGGAEATFRVLCYSAAPLALGLVPMLGPLVGSVWSVALTVLGLKLAHRTSIASAMFAVLVPIMLLLAAVVGLLQGMAQAV